MSDSAPRVLFTRKSANAKTGPIPVSMSTSNTCPDACPLKAGGCYAQTGPMALHWRRLDAGKTADPLDWRRFTLMVSALPEGQLWRHNTAGDLPSEGDAIDAEALRALADANAGRRGFTYTHKPIDRPGNLDAIRNANARGFTVNLSADTLAEADALAETGLPVVVVQDAPEGTRADTTTPAGRKVATCPATYRDNITCATCKLCAVADRRVIVGFPAHGGAKRKAAAVARGAAAA